MINPFIKKILINELTMDKNTSKYPTGIVNIINGYFPTSLTMMILNYVSPVKDYDKKRNDWKKRFRFVLGYYELGSGHECRERIHEKSFVDVKDFVADLMITLANYNNYWYTAENRVIDNLEMTKRLAKKCVDLTQGGVDITFYPQEEKKDRVRRWPNKKSECKEISKYIAHNCSWVDIKNMIILSRGSYIIIDHMDLYVRIENDIYEIINLNFPLEHFLTSRVNSTKD